jgi:hypothetical protein
MIESKEGKEMKKEESPSSAEPYYYIGLVLKGTEKQYLNLLKYVNNRNHAQVIYQCKSLTYLRVSRDDGVRFSTAVPDIAQESKHKRGKSL